MSLICRWVFPYLIKKCMEKRRRLEEDYSEEEEYQRERKKRRKSFCFRLCNEQAQGDNMRFPYMQIISAFVRISILVLLLNFSLKLTN